MSTAETYAGYTLTARLPAASAAVERWRAEGPEGAAEVFLGPEMLARRARALPAWGPFPRILSGTRDGRWFVVVPGVLEQDLEDLREQLSPGAALAFAWHLSAVLAEVHEQGGAHGALHPSFCGVDDQGHLAIRPALAAAVRADPDPEASAQATDCLQMSSLFESLDLERVEEPSVGLLLAGLGRDRARLRMQPGRAVRQALAAVLHRHKDWESRLVEQLGPAWKIDVLPRAPRPTNPAPRQPWNEASVPSSTGWTLSARQMADVEPATVRIGGPITSRGEGGLADRPPVWRETEPRRVQAAVTKVQAAVAKLQVSPEEAPDPSRLAVASMPITRMAPDAIRHPEADGDEPTDSSLEAPAALRVQAMVPPKAVVEPDLAEEPAPSAEAEPAAEEIPPVAEAEPAPHPPAPLGTEDAEDAPVEAPFAEDQAPASLEEAPTPAEAAEEPVEEPAEAVADEPAEEAAAEEVAAEEAPAEEPPAEEVPVEATEVPEEESAEPPVEAPIEEIPESPEEALIDNIAEEPAEPPLPDASEWLDEDRTQVTEAEQLATQLETGEAEAAAEEPVEAAGEEDFEEPEEAEEEEEDFTDPGRPAVSILPAPVASPAEPIAPATPAPTRSEILARLAPMPSTSTLTPTTTSTLAPPAAPPAPAPSNPPASPPAPRTETWSRPPPEPARISIQPDRSGDGSEAPRWAGARGVTGDDSRESELGTGKWSEEARSLEDVRRELGDDRPVRDLDLEASKANYGIIAFFFILVLGLIAWAVFAPPWGDGDAPAPTVEEPPAEAPEEEPSGD